MSLGYLENNPRGENLSALDFADGSKGVGYLGLRGGSKDCAGDWRKPYPTPILIRPF